MLKKTEEDEEEEKIDFTEMLILIITAGEVELLFVITDWRNCALSYRAQLMVVCLVTWT